MIVEELDLAVVGGGPAGMSAALIAGRGCLRTVLFNAERPRNRVTTASHGFLTRDGAHPLELLALGKEQLRPYETVRYFSESVTSLRAQRGGFVLTTSERSIWAPRVILATGYRDDLDLLGIPGLSEAYGKSVYPCPFCDGFEHRDQRLAVFGSEGVEHFVPIVRNWSNDVVVFTNGVALNDDAARGLGGRGVQVEEAPIRRLVVEEGRLRSIDLDGAPSVERDAGFVFGDYSVPATGFADSLGVRREADEWGMQTYEADAFGKTNVPGVYLVGDARTGFGGLVAAAHEGASCVENIVHQVAAERWSRDDTRNQGRG